METLKYPVVLSIAGSDSSGGAGIQADIKTISALGCYAASAITAVTAQNTLGVRCIHAVPAAFVKEQIKAVLEDLKPLAVKIGMVPSAELAIAISEVLSDYQFVPVVFDPVMSASSGDKLIEDETVDSFKKTLFPLSGMVTPNLNEAEILAGMEISTIEDMRVAASRILKFDCQSVLVKGGHLMGPDRFDVFVDKSGNEHTFKSSAIDTPNTHGTGCSLSSAIASYVALGNEHAQSIAKSKEFIWNALYNGKDVKTGDGNGPINHFFDPQRLVKLNFML